MKEVIEDVISAIKEEANELLNYINYFDKKQFLKALNLLSLTKGKIIVTGVGKSGHIGLKIAATFSSTGMPAFFMHPTEALHGDLGVVTSQDTVIAISKSGESYELNAMLPALKDIKTPIISITSNQKSTLAKNADANLLYLIEKEACPNNLAPTTSTTLTLVIGDALAIAMMKINKIGSNEFARNHPGGRLGRRLLLKVKDLLIPLNDLTLLNHRNATMQDILDVLTNKGLGVAILTDEKGMPKGIITDGDIRRLVNYHREFFLSISPSEVMNKNFISIDSDSKAHDALVYMENREKPLNFLLVFSQNKKFEGVIRLHELYKALN